jgi:hypothetical protein
MWCFRSLLLPRAGHGGQGDRRHFPGRDADGLVPGVIAAMFVQSILWWLEHDRPCPPEEIASQSSRLIRAVIQTAAGESRRPPE